MELRIVDFEQAKILKELGFPQENDIVYAVKECYEDDGNYGRKHNIGDLIYSPCGLSRDEICDAPTLELVAKWLRKEKHLSIIVEDFECGEEYNTYFSHIINLDIKYFTDMISKDYKYWCKRHCGRWESENYKDYEDALSAGIDKAIEEIIEENK